MINLSEMLRFDISPHNLPIRREQVRVRLSMYPSMVLSQATLQLLLGWMLWNKLNHNALIAWMITILFAHAFELQEWFLHRHRSLTIDDCLWWDRRFKLHTSLVAAIWGIGWLVMFVPGELIYQTILICVAMGVTSAAVTINPVYRPSIIIFQTLLMFPLILRLVWENDSAHWFLGGFMLVSYQFLIHSGARLTSSFEQSQIQRFENIELVRELAMQKDEIEQARKALQSINAHLEELVNERTEQLLKRTEEIQAIKDAMILAMSSLIEARDNETGNHIRRTQNYVRDLAESVRDHPRFSEFMTDENVNLLYKLAPLHDMGKVGIPDHILHKPDKLTYEEFEIMKTHTEIGGNAILKAEKLFELNNSFLTIARQIAAGHHEKWDGSGYPLGLCGDDIPIPARLMALADVYDALSCKRVYKAAMPHDEVVSIIVAGRGKHFDPDVVDAFLKIEGIFIEIAMKYNDNAIR